MELRQEKCAAPTDLALETVRVPMAWVTGDSVYGNDRRLRVWLEEQDHAYVMAVSGPEYVWRAGPAVSGQRHPGGAGDGGLVPVACR
jgi:SRSO17 transposase